MSSFKNFSGKTRITLFSKTISLITENEKKMFFCKYTLFRSGKANMKTVAVLVLIGIFAVRAQLQQSGPCPQVPFMRKFNLTKMMGIWYEQIHTQRWSDLELECNSQMFTYKTNTTFTYDTFARNPVNKTSQYHRQGNVSLKQANNTITALNVTEGSESYDVLVIDTDYRSFATLWTCMPAEASHYENIVVLTREKFPGLSALLSALDALDAKNITRMYLVYTEQRQCPKFSFSDPANTTTTKVNSFTSVPPIDNTTPHPTSFGDSTQNTASSFFDSNSNSPGAPHATNSLPPNTIVTATVSSAPSSSDTTFTSVSGSVSTTPSSFSNSPSTQTPLVTQPGSQSSLVTIGSSSAPDTGTTEGFLITSSGTTQGSSIGTSVIQSSSSGMTTIDSHTSNPDSGTTSNTFSSPGSVTTAIPGASDLTTHNTETTSVHDSTNPGSEAPTSTTQATIKSSASSNYSVLSSIVTSITIASCIFIMEYLL